MSREYTKYLRKSFNENRFLNWQQIISAGVLFLFFPPFISLLYLIGSNINKQKSTQTNYYILFACLALYFGSINSTKYVTGDQYQYYAAYMNVPQIGFWKSLIYIYGADLLKGYQHTNISGEFMNGIYNYFGYYLTFGYYPLFALYLTFTMYFLTFIGFYKFAKNIIKPHIPIVCGVLVLSFFYLFFNYTLQIQKQFLAQSIMMYVLGSYADIGKMTKKIWVVTLIACFTHASTFLFIPFLIYKPFQEILTKKRLVLLIGLGFIFILLGPSIAGTMIEAESSSALSYGARRLALSETNNDTEFGLVWSQVYVVAVPMAFIALRKLWIGRRNLSKKNAFILNIVLFLLVAITGMYRQPLAQYRYFMMLFAFMPFVYPFIFEKIRKRDSFLKGLSFIMIAWFYLQFEKIIWHYADEWEIVVKPPIMLILGDYKII